MSKSLSKYREVLNLVKLAEDSMRCGYLTNMEVFFPTENTITESAYYRGTYKRKILFQLVLIL